MQNIYKILKSCKIDKKRVAENFRASLATYEESAQVQNEIACQLMSYLRDQQETDRVIDCLEIGCCTGYLAEQMCTRLSVGTYFGNDIVPEFTELTCQRIESRCGRVCALPGDIETVELPDSLDLVISSATFQWIEDLEGLFTRIAAALSPGGVLLFSMFGPGTMHEISSLRGSSLDFPTEEKLQAMLAGNFVPEWFVTCNRVLYFDTVRAILKHIKKTGVGGVGGIRWTRKSLQKFEKGYRDRFATKHGLPVRNRYEAQRPVQLLYNRY